MADRRDSICVDLRQRHKIVDPAAEAECPSRECGQARIVEQTQHAVTIGCRIVGRPIAVAQRGNRIAAVDDRFKRPLAVFQRGVVARKVLPDEHRNAACALRQKQQHIGGKAALFVGNRDRDDPLFGLAVERIRRFLDDKRGVEPLGRGMAVHEILIQREHLAALLRIGRKRGQAGIAPVAVQHKAFIPIRQLKAAIGHHRHRPLP